MAKHFVLRMVFVEDRVREIVGTAERSPVITSAGTVPFGPAYALPATTANTFSSWCKSSPEVVSSMLTPTRSRRCGED